MTSVLRAVGKPRGFCRSLAVLALAVCSCRPRAPQEIQSLNVRVEPDESSACPAPASLVEDELAGRGIPIVSDPRQPISVTARVRRRALAGGACHYRVEFLRGDDIVTAIEADSVADLADGVARSPELSRLGRELLEERDAIQRALANLELMRPTPVPP